MKATINGTTIEGTPQEIMEYQRIQAPKALAPHPLDQMKYWREWQEAQKKQQWVDCGATSTPDYLKWPFVTSNNHSPIDQAYKMITWNGGYVY